MKQQQQQQQKKKKKKKKRSFNPYSDKTQESLAASSSSPRFLFLLRSKLSAGKELKLFFRNLTRRKNREGTLQARLGRCPKCQKTIQEPEDSPVHRCSRCEAALQSKRSKPEGKVARISDISVSEATLLSAEQCDFRAEDDPEDDGSKVSYSKSFVRKTQHVYDPPASSSRTRSYDSRAAYEHEKSDFRKEWLKRDKFPVTSDSDMLVHGRSFAYSIRYKNLPPVPFYPASPSLSSSKQRNHHQLKQFRQYEREGWSGETSSISSIHFSGETTDSRYYQLLSGQSPMRHFRHQRFPGQSFYDYSSSFMATPLLSERPYPVWSSKTESCSQKCTCSDMNGGVKERIPVVKCHVLPTAGGAPFVTCYYCSELLQLSQVFLHCKKKRYLVRCGCCSGVLNFSPNVSDPYLSRRDDSIRDHLKDRGSASVDHEKCCPDKGHLSYSDKDCKDSVCKSRLSNDGELVSPLKSLAKSQDAYSEHSHNMYENPNERSVIIDAGKVSIDGSGVSMEDIGYKNEKTNKTTEEEEAKTTEDRLVSDRVEPANEDGSTCKTWYQEEGYSMEKPQEQDEYGGGRTWRDTTRDTPRLHLEEYETNYDNPEGRFSKEYEWNDGAERVPTFRLGESELGKLFGPGEAIEEISDLSVWGALNDLKISSEALESNDETKERVLSENKTKPIKPVEVSKLCLGEQLGHEEETIAEMLYSLDLSRDMIEKPRQTLEPRAAAEEDRSDFSSRLCSTDHENSSTVIKHDDETTVLTPGALSEHIQDEDDKTGLTFEPYAHLCTTMDPSEIVGLRHALYKMGSSPLRSPLSSPLRFHIVSPLRSPVNSPPSLSDVLFFSKRF